MDETTLITSSTRFQLALLKAGLLDQAKAVASNDPQLSIYWNTSINVISSEPWVKALTTKMAITDSEMRQIISSSVEG